MEGVLDSRLDKWEVKAPVPSTQIRTVCKQISKLYDTIDGLLPEVTCKFYLFISMVMRYAHTFKKLCLSLMHKCKFDIFKDHCKDIITKIHSKFKQKLSRKLKMFQIRNDGGPRHGLVMSDVAFYEGSMKVCLQNNFKFNLQFNRT